MRIGKVEYGDRRSNRTPVFVEGRRAGEIVRSKGSYRYHPEGSPSCYQPREFGTLAACKQALEAS
jgi:hypothetical protein